MDPESNGDGIVQRMPVPMNVHVDVVSDTEGQRFLIMVFNTPIGEQTYFIPGSAALHFAETVRRKAALANSGLVIPE